VNIEEGWCAISGIPFPWMRSPIIKVCVIGSIVSCPEGIIFFKRMIFPGTGRK
jgi:hypothetical protein